MKSKMRLLLVLALAACMSLTVACGGSPSTTGSPSPAGTTDNGNTATPSPMTADTPAASEAVSLKVWAPPEEQEITIQMCTAFQEAHPEYQITFDYAIESMDNVINDLKKDADVAGDVFMYPTGGIPELVEAGLIYPITIDKDAITSLHSEPSIAACTYQGQMYGVPVTPNSWFMYYDKSKYTEDDVKSLESMMAKDLGAGVANFSCTITNSWYISAFFYANGCTLFGADGTDPTECSWNSPAGVEVGNYLVDLSSNPKYVEDKDGVAGTMMREGKLGALCSGTWAAQPIKEALGDNYAACKLPTIHIGGADKQLRNFADFKAYGVKSRTKAPKAAQQLAAWLCNEANQLQRFETNAYAPTVKSLLTNPTVLANKEVTALSVQTQYSIPNPTTSKLADYWTPATAFGSGIDDKSITKDNMQASLDTLVANILGTLTN